MPQPSILIAEDNMVNRMVISAILDGFNCQYTLAEDGALGVAAFKNGTFDLVITDIHMPNMNGLEMAKAIHALDPTIPIVALTADISADMQEKVAASSIQNYYSKPLKKGDIKEILSTHLPNHNSTK